MASKHESSNQASKSTRYKSNPTKLFECYCEVSFKAKDVDGILTRKPYIKRRFPPSYKVKDVLESVPKFAYPCNNIVVDEVVQFSFVLTNIESKWTFGYCRMSPQTETCIVVISQLPWQETFHKITNHIGEMHYISSRQDELLSFLSTLYETNIVDKSCQSMTCRYRAGDLTKEFSYDIPDQNQVLPSIPQDRNLTEFYNAASVDNMIALFASAINERRVLVLSNKLNRLSSCVQALNNILYPMHWQHIFIPVLPADLLAYLQAPMPFLIGLPESTYKELNSIDLSDVVMFLADDNIVRNAEEDVRALPPSIVNSIKSDIKKNGALGDCVSRAFLRAIVMLIGGYRWVLECNNGRDVTFNQEKFASTRSFTYEPFLRKLLDTQMFRQFIEGRLELLQAGQGFNDDFEFEVNLHEERTAKKGDLSYQDLTNAMKSKSGELIRSMNPSLKLMYRGLRDKSKQTYKDLKVKLNDTQTPGPSQSFSYSRMG